MLRRSLASALVVLALATFAYSADQTPRPPQAPAVKNNCDCPTGCTCQGQCTCDRIPSPEALLASSTVMLTGGAPMLGVVDELRKDFDTLNAKLDKLIALHGGNASGPPKAPPVGTVLIDYSEQQAKLAQGWTYAPGYIPQSAPVQNFGYSQPAFASFGGGGCNGASCNVGGGGCQNGSCSSGRSGRRGR